MVLIMWVSWTIALLGRVFISIFGIWSGPGAFVFF